MHNSRQQRPGSMLLEVLIAMGVLVFLGAAFAQLSIGAYEGGYEARDRTQANYLAHEGLEAVRFLALEDYDQLTDGTHGVAPTGGVFAFSGSSTAIGDYTRTVEISTAERDGGGNLVDSGGSADTRTKAVRSTVTWNALRGAAKQVSLLTYITQWRAAAWLIDLLADFQSGFINSSQYVSNDDGEIEVIGTNSFLNLSTAQGLDSNGNTDITALAIDTRSDLLYAAGRSNIGTDSELLIFDISDVSNTGVVEVDAIEIGADIIDIVIGDEHAFFITDNTAAEVQVLDLATRTVVDTYDIAFDSAMAEARSLYIDTANNRLLVGTDADGSLLNPVGELYVFDVSDPTNISVSNELEINKNVQAVALYGDYAFLGSDDAVAEIYIVDVTNELSFAICDLVDTQGVTALQVVDDRLFVGRSGGLSAEFMEFTIPALNPLSCVMLLANLQGSVDMNSDDVNDMYVDTDLNRAFVTVFDSAGDLFSINLDDFSSAEFDVAATDFCESVVQIGAYVYTGCRDNGETLEVLQGGSAVGSTFTEDIYTDSAQNSWTIQSTGGNSHDAAATLLVRTGASSLSVNPSSTGKTTFGKSVSISNSGSIQFYVNTVSPWAFGIYGDNGGTPHGTTTVLQSVFSSTYETNDEENNFTDFPAPDYSALRTRAQAKGAYINAGNQDKTLTVADLLAYSGKVIFVDFSNSSRVLKIDFGGSSLAYTFSLVMYGGDRIQLENYNSTTLITASGSFPALTSSNIIRFASNNNMTVNGVMYAADRFESNSLSGNRRITVNGSIVAGRIDNRTERVNLLYSTNYNQSPPNYFTPNYYGQQLALNIDNGTNVNLEAGMSAPIDRDPSTWQLVNISFNQLAVSAGTMSALNLVDVSGQNQPTFFVDDARITSIAEAPETGLTRWATYTSPAFDSGTPATSWGEISWTSSGSITFRIRTASSEAGLADAIWVGSDGTMGTVYSTSAGQAIQTDGSASGTRWIQWKAYLPSNGTSTPILEDVSISY